MNLVTQEEYRVTVWFGAGKVSVSIGRTQRTDLHGGGEGLSGPRSVPGLMQG